MRRIASHHRLPQLLSNLSLGYIITVQCYFVGRFLNIISLIVIVWCTHHKGTALYIFHTELHSIDVEVQILLRNNSFNYFNILYRHRICIRLPKDAKVLMWRSKQHQSVLAPFQTALGQSNEEQGIEAL